MTTVFEIALPVTDNGGRSLIGAHRRFREAALKIAGGYTRACNQRGQWRSETGLMYTDWSTPYRVACTHAQWSKLLAKAHKLFPDQEALFWFELGQATFSPRPQARRAG